MLTNLKDYLVRKVATSFILKYADGHKIQIGRAVQALNHLVAAFLILGALADQYFGWNTLPALNAANAQLLALSQLLGGGLLSLGLADADAKARLEEKKLETPVVVDVK